MEASKEEPKDGGLEGNSNPHLTTETMKLFAAREPNPSCELIHISQAFHGTTYFHPTNFKEMYARKESNTPVFCYKSDHGEQEPSLGIKTFRGGEGLVHQLVKRELQRTKSLVLTVDGRPEELRFTKLLEEYRPTNPSLPIVIDLVGVLEEPKNLSKRFGGGLNIEIHCSNCLNTERREHLRALPYAAAEISIERALLTKIEGEAFELSRSIGVAAKEQITKWEEEIARFLSAPQLGLFHIPGEPRLQADGKPSLEDLLLFEGSSPTPPPLTPEEVEQEQKKQEQLALLRAREIANQAHSRKRT